MMVVDGGSGRSRPVGGHGGYADNKQKFDEEYKGTMQ
jgi:hypothetical protein